MFANFAEGSFSTATPDHNSYRATTVGVTQRKAA
jgi:hypothetical protein